MPQGPFHLDSPTIVVRAQRNPFSLRVILSPWDVFYHGNRKAKTTAQCNTCLVSCYVHCVNYVTFQVWSLCWVPGVYTRQSYSDPSLHRSCHIDTTLASSSHCECKHSLGNSKLVSKSGLRLEHAVSCGRASKANRGGHSKYGHATDASQSIITASGHRHRQSACLWTSRCLTDGLTTHSGPLSLSESYTSRRWDIHQEGYSQLPPPLLYMSLRQAAATLLIRANFKLACVWFIVF